MPSRDFFVKEISILLIMKSLQKFSKGAGMLAIMGVLGKMIGVLYRLPLTNILGAEGMGLYQMIFPLYSLCLAISCGGIPTAISKYVSELCAKGGRNNARRALTISIAVLAVIGAVAATLIVIFRNRIAAVQGNQKVAIAYAALAPAIVFSGIIACYRGYFQGLQNLLPSGVSQLTEQIAKVVFGLFFATALLDKGIEYGVMGAIIGISVSEVLAFAYLAVRIRFGSRAKLKTANSAEAAADIADIKKVDARQIVKSIYSVAIPVTLGSLVLPLSQVMDSFLVVNLLQKSGVQTSLATSLYGLFNGPVGSLLNVPTVITVALAASLLPKVAYCHSKGLSAKREVDTAISVYFAIMLVCSVLFAFAPEPILSVLYSRGLSNAELVIASAILRIESVNVLAIGFVQLTSAVMQGVGSVRTPVINLLIGAIAKIVITVTLIPTVGIYGAAVGNVVFYAVTATLNATAAKRRYGAYLNCVKLAKILFCASVFASVFSSYFLLRLVINEILAFFCAAAIAGTAYLMLLVKTKCILLREMLS